MGVVYDSTFHYNQAAAYYRMAIQLDSAFVDEDLRRRMGDVAVKAAEAVSYESAGTIECLVDADKKRSISTFDLCDPDGIGNYSGFCSVTF